MARVFGLACLALLAAACGHDRTGDASQVRDDPRPRFAHVHGLGLNAADDLLYVATHTGLYKLDGGGSVRPAGSSRKDLMGFSVVGPDHFIASGHPEPRDTTADGHLGLISSSEAGRSWERVSLAGKADFHVLRAAANRVYGWDPTRGRFLASTDGGRTWGERRPPGAMLDLAMHPRDADQLVASTEAGLHTSNDGGATWRWIADGPIHGVGFLLLLYLVARGAGERQWGWWFPALVLVTLGPPGSLIGDVRIRRALARRAGAPST